MTCRTKSTGSSKARSCALVAVMTMLDKSAEDGWPRCGGRTLRQRLSVAGSRKIKEKKKILPLGCSSAASRAVLLTDGHADSLGRLNAECRLEAHPTSGAGTCRCCSARRGGFGLPSSSGAWCCRCSATMGTPWLTATSHRRLLVVGALEAAGVFRSCASSAAVGVILDLGQQQGLCSILVVTQTFGQWSPS